MKENKEIERAKPTKNLQKKNKPKNKSGVQMKRQPSSAKKQEKEITSQRKEKPQKKQIKERQKLQPMQKETQRTESQRRRPQIQKMRKNDKKRNTPPHPLRIIPLGGLQEIGKNMTAFEYGDEIVVIDCGMGFPDDDMLGVDLVIPDISYLVQNAHKVKGILITHGHEDHIGSIPYVLSQLDVPIYGTRLSLGIIEGKLDENPPPHTPRLNTVEAGDVVKLGSFSAEFIHVNHSIADACAIALFTPAGTVLHSGDFKLDVSPIDGKIIDITRLGTLGKEGVDLLLCESTNAERGGYTPSERTVGSSLERIFSQYEDKRLIIATFSSNVHRVQQIINASAAHSRKVAVLGRSMVNVIGAATELGYMDLPDGVLVDVSEIKKYKPEELTLITTGSQGEPMSALYRIAFSEHDKVKLSSGDVVVLSASAIPGNEKLVGKIINALVRNGVKVVNDSTEDVHVSGHACKEEIKLLMALTRPKYFMPIHGEDRHLYANKETAEFMGIPSQNIFVSEIGRVLELSPAGARFSGSVPSGKVLVDGSGVGDIGSVVLRDRKHLAEDGLVVVVATVDMTYGEIVSGPDIVSRGFVYVKESEELMNGAKRVVTSALERVLARRAYDFAEIKMTIREELARFITKETKRKPMILPVIMDV